MNLFDIILILVLVFFLVKGLIRGVFLEVLTLIGMIVGYVVALREMDKAASLFARWLTDVPAIVSSALGFLSIFLVVIVLFRIAAVMLHKMFKKTPIALLDRGGGLLVGLCKGLLIASLVAHLISWIPLEDKEFSKEREQSWLLKPSKAVAPFVFNLIKHVIPQTETFADEVEGAVLQVEKKVKQGAKNHIEDQIKEQLNGTTFSE